MKKKKKSANSCSRGGGAALAKSLQKLTWQEVNSSLQGTLMMLKSQEWNEVENQNPPKLGGEDAHYILHAV